MKARKHRNLVQYSLVETAKANGLIPFDYVKFLFEELPKEPGILITCYHEIEC